MNKSFRVCEVVADGLPVAVHVCHVYEQPSLRHGETVRWLLSGLKEPTARRLARWRIAEICRWSTGREDRPPPWLRSHVPIPPQRRGRGFGRPVVRCHPDGRAERFASVQAAARAVGRDPVVLRRRLFDRRADHDGCAWCDP